MRYFFIKIEGSVNGSSFRVHDQDKVKATNRAKGRFTRTNPKDTDVKAIVAVERASREKEPRIDTTKKWKVKAKAASKAAPAKAEAKPAKKAAKKKAPKKAAK